MYPRGWKIVFCYVAPQSFGAVQYGWTSRVVAGLLWVGSDRNCAGPGQDGLSFLLFFFFFFFPRESSHRNVKFWVATVVNEIIWNRPVKASLPACKKNTSAQARLRQTSPPPLPFRLSVTETGQIDRIG